MVIPLQGMSTDGEHHNGTRTANVLHLDTGSGFGDGQLTLARIDADPIETVTMGTVR